MKSRIANDVYNELNTSPGLYFNYISNLISTYENSDQDLYYISKNNFQNYVIARYHEDIRTDDQMKTINEIFQTISQQSQKNIMIVFDALIDIDFGDNRTKADRIAKYITSFDLISDPNLYQFFDHILLYLFKILRSSIHLILQPIRDKIWDLNSTKKPDEMKAGIYTLMSLFKNFSFCFKSVMSKVRNYICDILKSADSEVRLLAIELLKQLLTTSSDFEKQKSYLATDFVVALTNSDSRILEGYVLASELFLELYPEKISDFKFKSINFEFFDSPDIEKKISALFFIPFQVRTTPELFNTNQNITFFTKVEPLLNKRNMIRNEALLSFGKFIFNQRLAKIKYSEEMKIIAKCKKAINDSLDSKQAIFALLASLIVDTTTFERDSAVIFNQPISNYLVDGFKMIIEIEPTKKNFIWTNFMKMADKLFLSHNPNPDQLTILFQSFLKLEIPNTLLTVTNAIQFSKYLYSHRNHLKKAVIDFLLKYNGQNQSEEIILILLAYIGIETDEQLRVHVIQTVSQVNLVSEEIIIAFQSFLNDFSRKIREYSYSYLNRFLYISSIKYRITQNLYQEIKNIRETDKLLKENLEPFLELCKVSFSGSSENSETALAMLTSFAPFLIDRILNEQRSLFSAALEILTYLVQIMPEKVDENMSSLVNLLMSAFTIHPTKRFLHAALTLFLQSIQYTSLKISIYKEHSSLISRLLQLTKLPSYEVSYDLLFQSIIVVGSIRASIINHSKSGKNNISGNDGNKIEIMSAFSFIAQSASNKNQDKLVFASVGVAISHIFYILDNDFLSTLHSDAVNALVLILNSCRQISDALSNQILDRIDILIQSNSISTISTMLSSIHIFLAVFGNKFTPIVSNIVDFICDHWNSIDQSLLTKTIIHIIQFIPDSITAHLPRLVKCITTGFDIYPLTLSLLIMSAFDSMESAISTIDYIAYPVILSWVTLHSKSTNECKEALSNLRRIFAFGGTTQYSTLIIRTMIEIVSINPYLNDNAADVLTVVARQIGKSFMIFVPLIESVFTLNEKMPLYQIIKSYETNSEIPKIVDELCLLEPSRKYSVTSKKPIIYSKNQEIQLNIPTEPAFSSWHSWADDFFSLIIQQSNSRAIQLCGSLSERHSILKEAIAPISIALMIIDPPSREFGEKMKSCIDTILLQYLNVPKSLIKTFLDSFELFELLRIDMPISIDLVFSKSLNVGNLQQALRAGETLFEKPFYKQINELTGSLLTINQKLGLPLANKGLLILAKSKNIQLDVSTDEKLGFWDLCLESYTEKLVKDPNNKEYREKSLKCIQNMFQFNKLKEMSNGFQVYKASAHWHLLEFEEFAKTAEKLPYKDEQGLFYRILLEIYKGDNYNETLNKISLLKQKKMKNGLSLVSDDYEICLPEFNKYSIIFELESALSYKIIQKKMETAHIYDIQKLRNELKQNEIQWKERFDHLPHNPIYLYEPVCVRSLVMSRDRMKPYFDRLVHSLIDQKQTQTARETLEISDAFNDVEKSKITAEIEWADNNSEKALNLILSIIKNDQNPELHLIAGEWLTSLNKMQEAKEMVQKILPKLSSRSDVWKLWAKINLLLSKTNPECLATSFEASINGLIHYDNDINNLIDVDDNIQINDYDDNVNCKLNFVLPILSTLFCHGNDQIYSIFLNHLKEIPPNSWFDVLPQIIARMNSKDPTLRQIVEEIIVIIGNVIPHAVLYSLLVPLSSKNEERKEMAQNVISKLKLNYPQMIDKTIRFTNELIRIGSTWWEKWSNQIEEAFRALYKRQNMKEMVNIIKPLFALLKKTPETLYEVSFYRSFGPALSEAENFFNIFLKTKDLIYLNSSLNILSDVSNQLKPIITSLDKIILEDASPILSNLTEFDFNVTIPGLNDLDSSLSGLVTVKKIEDKIDCMKSKQKPRRVAMIGSNGQRYLFLLKANEDTRLDERVMQLFTFINTLTRRSPSRTLPLKKKLNITTYDVIPLTNEIGLIGWVPNSSTISQKIIQYRKKFDIKIDSEIERAIKFAGGTIDKYENLPLNRRVEAFKQGFKTTAADDLSKILFLEATSSEHWLQRRTNYTTSLVMTSIVGYIIGLGDRHTNNIMMNEKTAKLVHIDFGDCFEVAINRSYRPEKVPFRLTRIFVRALEVSRIEGTFRCSCENLMKLLRRNSDQISGLLNVFLYDPLLQWIIANEGQGMKSASAVLDRIDDKLNGRDFDDGKVLSVEDQIDRLINEATNNENLASMFYGWGPWW